MKIKILSLIIISQIFLLTKTMVAQPNNSFDWKQFRGNNKDGISKDDNLSLWSEKAPELAWKKEIGTGFSEVVVSGDKLYITFGDSVNDKGSEFVMACDVATGNQLWKTEIDSLYIDPEKWGDGPRATPAIDDKHIYCFSAFGKLMALSIIDGSIIWKVDLIKDFESQLPRYGYTSSPLLAENILFMETGGKNGKSFTAFDTNTGKALWSKNNGASSYNSPIIAKINNETNIIMIIDSMMYSYDINGNIKWEFDMPIRFPTAVPVFVSPNKIFVSDVSPIGSIMIQIENNIATEVFNSNTMNNNWSSSLYYNGYIFGFNNAKLQCNLAIDGSIKWSQRGFGKGSLILVGDKLLVLSDKGVLKQIEASPEAYKEIGSIQALDGKSWTAPSYSNGRVFLRNLSEMSCYIIK